VTQNGKNKKAEKVLKILE